MARGVTRHLRLLPRLKCLTASKTSTVLDYPRNFGNAAKDGLKRTTRWVVYYFTNPNSWYPTPGRAMILPAITAIHPLPPLQVTVQSIQKMRDWVQTSALCQTGNNDGNSWNSPFVPLSEKNLALHFSLTSRSSKKTTGNKKKRKMDY